jgi:pimeloyl-ACP methyl ester carboxylesterase
LGLFLQETGINLSTSILLYNVDVYKVTYKTSYQDQTISASGLVILPNNAKQSLGMISFAHGTIASQPEAPTALSSNDFESILYAELASTGFITVIPDFIGFGSSSHLLHPYYVQEASASANIDLLQAARELAIQKNVSFNGKLFLAGYSQGGYVTMATHKAIEQNGLENFELVASFPSSGGYDVKGMQEYFFGLETYAEPFFIAFVADAYKTYYQWTQPLSDFFQSKYATIIPGLFDGTKSGGVIDGYLNDTIPKLISPQLLSSIDTDPSYQYIVTAFNHNSLLDWFPTKRMFMYHGDADVTVPYQNSVDTYNKLISNGALSSTLTLTSFPGKTHYTGLQPYIETFVPQLILLK